MDGGIIGPGEREPERERVSLSLSLSRVKGCMTERGSFHPTNILPALTPQHDKLNVRPQTHRVTLADEQSGAESQNCNKKKGICHKPGLSELGCFSSACPRLALPMLFRTYAVRKPTCLKADRSQKDWATCLHLVFWC